MEYLENGDFKDGKFEPWRNVGTPTSVEPEGDRYYVLMSAGGKVNQRFTIDDVQPRPFVVSLEVRVPGGTDNAEGKLQLIWQYGTRFLTYNIVESSQWRTVTIPVNVTSPVSTNTLEVLVQQRFDKDVSVTNISLSDDNAAQAELDGAVLDSDTGE